METEKKEVVPQLRIISTERIISNNDLTAGITFKDNIKMENMSELTFSDLLLNQSEGVYEPRGTKITKFSGEILDSIIKAYVLLLFMKLDKHKINDIKKEMKIYFGEELPLAIEHNNIILIIAPKISENE